MEAMGIGLISPTYKNESMWVGGVFISTFTRFKLVGKVGVSQNSK